MMPQRKKKKKEEIVDFAINSTYDNFLYFDEVQEGSGYTTFNIEYQFESDTGTYAGAKLMQDGTFSSGCAGLSETGYKKVSATCFSGQYDDWTTGAPVKKDCAKSANKMQIYITDSGNQPVAGKVYIKKAWLSASGKDDLVLHLHS